MQHQEFLSEIRKALEHDRTVVLAYVFGSVARGEAAEGSDLDVAILADDPMEPNRMGILAEAFGRAIGFHYRVDLVDLRTASPALVAEVVKDGIRVLERSPEERLDFEMNAIRRYEDTKPLRRLQHDLLREKAHGRS